MEGFLKKIMILTIFLLIWIILNENLHMYTLVTGVVVSILALRVSNHMLKIDYTENFYLSPIRFWMYFIKLIKDIYVYGFQMIIRIFKGDMSPTFIEYESRLKDEMSLLMLVNNITLPPGSITVARDGNRLLVLSANGDEKAIELDILGLERSISNLKFSKKGIKMRGSGDVS